MLSFVLTERQEHYQNVTLLIKHDAYSETWVIFLGAIFSMLLKECLDTTPRFSE